eukprot:241004_1
MGNSMSILSVITFLSVSILAKPMPISPTLRKQFSEIDDIDKTDGEITNEELSAAVEKNLDFMGKDASTFDASLFISRGDSNQDGKLNVEEFSIAVPFTKMFRLFDQNGDGKLSKDEFNAAFTDKTGFATPDVVKAAFDEVDVDGSGDLEYSEFLNVKVFTDAAPLAKAASSGVLVSASLSCLFIILLQLF